MSKSKKPTGNEEEPKPKKPRKARKPKKQVIQLHHITYEDGRKMPPAGWTVRLTRGEHGLLTRLQWFGSLSEGAKTALLYEISRKPTRVIE